MAKTKTKQPFSSEETRLDYYKKLDKINAELLTMRYLDLQKSCIIRGMDPDILVESDIGKLQTWLIKNWETITDSKRLDAFDEWRLAKLKILGKEGEPFVKMGYVGEENEETGDVEIKRPKKIKKASDKREKDETMGIFKGTKKALTYQCVKEGLSIEETTTKVKSIFADAKDKSIKIWMKRAKKAIEALE
jgi:hypothetical protein